MYTDVKRFGNNIMYRGYNEHGAPIQKKYKFSPTLFVRSDEPSEWSTIYGDPVTPMEFDTMKEASDFVKMYDGVDNFEIHGNTNYVAQFITQRFPKSIKFNTSFINVVNLDIEVGSEDGFPYPEEAKYEVQSIALRSSKDKVFRVWGLGDYDVSKAKMIPDGYLVKYVKCSDEIDLLARFLTYWSSNWPDVITGWNIRLFDMPYLINRITRVMSEEAVKKFSPWGHVNYKALVIKGKELDSYEIYGIQQLDYMDLFLKFGLWVYGPQESYSLDHIANVVVGERKLSYDEHGSLHRLYKEDYQKFIDYNIRDCYLVERIDAETGLLDLVMSMAYRGGVNFTDTLGTTAIWDSIIYRELNEKKVVPPPSENKFKPKYPGGYVKEPVPNKYHWVASFDLTSLYPMTIVQYNMSPETIVGDATMPEDVDYYLEKKRLPLDDVCHTANGVQFRKDKDGIIPSIIERYFAMRDEAKKKMIDTQKRMEAATDPDEKKRLKHEANLYKTQQMSIKILMNSLYGALGNKYFRYFDIRMAKSITLSGQLAIRWAEKAVNEYMNKVMKTTDKDYVIYMDTDSLYLSLDDAVKIAKPKDPIEFMDKVCSQKIEPVIKKAYQDLFDYMNAYKNKMNMDREVLADAAIWTAKKRYIINVHDNEGVRYAEPKMKIMGIEAVKSSTPMVVRTKFKEAFRIMLLGEERELHTFIEKFYDEFSALPPEDVSSPRGVSEIDKWRNKSGPTLYKSGCPIHVRGSILYNDLTKKMGVYSEEIKNGTKVKFCYLKMPNPLRENIIAFPQFLPRELGIHKYVDYEMQFDKSFKSPLKLIADSIGWNLERVSTLEDFFA